MAKRKGDSGQSLVFVALAMPVLLGFLGIGFDMGYMRYMKRKVQMAADAAAIAGANEIVLCASAGCSELTTAGVSAVQTDNSFPSVTQSASCAPAPSTGATLVVVKNPPSCCPGATICNGSSDPNNANNSFVEAIVAENVPTFFTRIFGFTSSTITARAEAGLGGGSSCVFALDTSGSGAITNALAGYSSSCGVVDESSNGSAFTCFLGLFNAPYIGVVGGDGFPLCIFGGASPTTGIRAPSPADPLAYRQAAMKAAAPSATTCGTSTSSPYTGHGGGLLTIAGTATLNPGTYCGGISINPGANVTFSPGIYTLTSTSAANGGLTVYAGTTVSGGGGIAFYNSDVRNGVVTPGSNGGINFVCSSCTLGSVIMTAPTSGAFEGVLFYQDPGNTSSSVVVGSATYNTKLTGTSYFPSASVTFAFDITVNYNDLVAKDITFGVSWNGNNIASNSYNNYGSLANGSPLKGSVALIGE